MKYRADIDGLRCLAVLPVVMFHAGFSRVSGGFIGVDVFFVISGFLITGILLSEMEAGTYSLLEFYQRRIRRIMPALFTTVAVTWIFAFVFFLPPYFVDFSKSVVSVGLFISNLYFWKFSGYFDNGAQLRPLLHTWSLSVEEQFYIFIPPILFLAHKYLKKISVILFILFAVISFILSVYCTKVATTANFFLLPTRAWELLIGSLLAMMATKPLEGRLVWLAHLMGIAGLVLIVAPIFLYSEATPFPGLAALAPCAGAAFIIYAGKSKGAISEMLLGWPPVVFIGQISYSLYLVHWPVVVFVRYVTLENPSLMSSTLIILVSVALAVASWWFVERPFRTKGAINSRKAIFALAIGTLFLMAGVGVAGVVSKGFPARFAAVPETPPSARDIGWHDGECFYQGGYTFTKWSPTVCDLTHNGNEAVLLWGDSYAAHYAPGIEAHAADLPYHVYQYTAAGCPPVLSYYSYARQWCTPFNQNALSIIQQLKIKKVIISARWVDLQLRGLDQFSSTMTALKRMGVDVYVIGQSPVFVTDVSLIAYKKSNGHQSEDSWTSTVRPDLNPSLRKIITSAGFSRASFVDPMEEICHGAKCPYRTNGQFLYSDNGHFTVSGSEAAVTAYFPLLDRPNK